MNRIQEVNISTIIQNLKKRRKIFHSEADFQHELAWEIHKTYPKYSIRLEKAFKLDEKLYVDIFFANSSKTAIELKYKTQALNYSYNNIENYNLTTHSAINLGRYDFLKDVERLENLKSNKLINKGFAIFLTNARSYWSKTSKSSKLSKDFYLTNNDNLNKSEYRWLPNVKKTSIGVNRMQPIKLSNTYKLNWSTYSVIDNNEFKILVLEV